MSREERGYIYLGRYQYAKELTGGRYSLYEGMYSDRAEDRTTGLEVVRDINKKPMRFKSLEDIKLYIDL